MSLPTTVFDNEIKLISDYNIQSYNQIMLCFGGYRGYKCRIGEQLNNDFSIHGGDRQKIYITHEN